VAAVAVEPTTVTPERLPTVMDAPTMKFDPKIVIDELLVIPYVTETGLTFVKVGCGAVTVNPPANVPDKPPEGAVFVTCTA
jgi:hypothetical protein